MQPLFEWVILLLNDLYHSLNPVAFSIGSLEVRWYGIAYILGFFFAGIVLYRVARRWKLRLSLDDVLLLIVCIAFGVIVGARVFYVCFYNLPYFVENPLHILMFSEGGMSFHGGLCGALIGGYLACRYLKISFLTTCDMAVVGAPLGLFFGRCANFINGELWGKAADLPWAVMFETGGGVYRHPSQLYEAVLEGLVLFVILYFLSRKNPPLYRGGYIGVFLVFYGFFRFLIEFVRVPDAQLGYLFGFLTMGQLLSIPLFVLGASVLVVSFKKKRPQSLSREAGR